MIGRGLFNPIRTREEARRDMILERLHVEHAKLQNLPLNDKRRGVIVNTIRALDTELDGFDDNAGNVMARDFDPGYWLGRYRMGV